MNKDLNKHDTCAKPKVRHLARNSIACWSPPHTTPRAGWHYLEGTPMSAEHFPLEWVGVWGYNT